MGRGTNKGPPCLGEHGDAGRQAFPGAEIGVPVVPVAAARLRPHDGAVGRDDRQTAAGEAAVVAETASGRAGAAVAGVEAVATRQPRRCDLQQIRNLILPNWMWARRHRPISTLASRNSPSPPPPPLGQAVGEATVATLTTSGSRSGSDR